MKTKIMIFAGFFSLSLLTLLTARHYQSVDDMPRYPFEPIFGPSTVPQFRTAYQRKPAPQRKYTSKDITDSLKHVEEGLSGKTYTGQCFMLVPPVMREIDPFDVYKLCTACDVWFELYSDNKPLYEWSHKICKTFQEWQDAANNANKQFEESTKDERARDTYASSMIRAEEEYKQKIQTLQDEYDKTQAKSYLKEEL